MSNQGFKLQSNYEENRSGRVVIQVPKYEGSAPLSDQVEEKQNLVMGQKPKMSKDKNAGLQVQETPILTIYKRKRERKMKNRQ